MNSTLHTGLTAICSYTLGSCNRIGPSITSMKPHPTVYTTLSLAHVSLYKWNALLYTSLEPKPELEQARARDSSAERGTHPNVEEICWGRSSVFYAKQVTQTLSISVYLSVQPFRTSLRNYHLIANEEFFMFLTSKLRG